MLKSDRAMSKNQAATFAGFIYKDISAYIDAHKDKYIQFKEIYSNWIKNDYLR